jgi:hypothetical protein
MVAVAMTVLQLASNPAYAEPSAGSLYKQGQLAEARQQYEEAFLAYRAAMERAPTDLRYRTV